MNTFLALGASFLPSRFRFLANRTMKSALFSKVSSGFFWTVLGSVVSRALSFFAFLCVARMIGRDMFGEVGLVRMTVAVFIEIGGVCMGHTAAKYLSELLVTDKERAGRIVGMNYIFTGIAGLFSVGLLFLLIPWICANNSHLQESIPSFQWAGLLVLLLLFDNAQKGVLAGFQDFQNLAVTNIISCIFVFPCIVAGAYLGEVTGTIIGLSIAAALSLFVNSLFIYRNVKKHQLRYAFFEAYKEIPTLLSFSTPILFCGIIATVSMFAAQLMLSWQKSGLAQMGILNAAMQIYLIILFLPGQLSQIVIPIVSEVRVTKSPSQYLKIVRLFVGMNFLVSFLVSLPVILFASPLMAMYGSEFTQGTTTLIFLALSAVSTSVLAISGRLIFTQKRLPRIIYVYQIAFALVLLSAAYYLIGQGWGGSGFAAALFAASTVQAVISGGYVCFFPVRND